MTDEASPESAAFFAQMFWRDELRPEPIVALLGPHGSGKAEALAALSRQCASTVVHARLNFFEHDLDPIQAAAFVSFEMMRGWDSLRSAPTFHRFALGLLARNEELSSSRPLAKRQIRYLVKDYVANTPQGQTAKRMAEVTSASLDTTVKSLSHLTASPLRAAALADIRQKAKPVIGSLLQSAAELTISDARRYYSEIPEAESAKPNDALISLSRAQPDLAIKILLQALFADMAAHTLRYRQLNGKCSCKTPDGQPARRGHSHVWVLLVNGAETASGKVFLAALARARAQRARSGDFDPLLVIAARGTWDTTWQKRWREPSHPQTGPDLPQRPIPLLSQATYQHWAADNLSALAKGDQAAVWFPVWLDPLSRPQAMNIVPADTIVPGVRTIAHRLTGGHRSALLALRDQLGAMGSARGQGPMNPGALLVAASDSLAPLWRRWIEEALPSELLAALPRWPDVPQTAVAAAYLADRRTSGDEKIPRNLPDLQSTLGLLRTHLWITAFSTTSSRIGAVTGEAAPAVLHPWLERCLLAAISVAFPAALDTPDQAEDAEPTNSSADAWDYLFAILEAAHSADPDRTLYYELARWERPPEPGAVPSPGSVLGLVPEPARSSESIRGLPVVAAALTKAFNTEDHRDWLRRVDYITSAPCRRPLAMSTEAAYQKLTAGTEGRPVIQVATTSLVALLWLYRDPLTEHTEALDSRIRGSIERLKANSERLDVSALDEAVACFPVRPTRPARPDPVYSQ